MRKHFLILSLVFTIGCSTESPKNKTTITTETSKATTEMYYKKNGDLEISNLNDSCFSFVLNGLNGANTGYLEGIGKFTMYKKGIYKMNECEIIFNFLADSTIQVVQNNGTCEAGVGVIYSGIYSSQKPERNKSPLQEIGVFKNKTTEEKFKNLTNSQYQEFVSTFEQIAEEENLDSIDANIYSGFVPGLGSIKEGIIMIGENEKIWAAILFDEKINYYSSQNNDTLKIPKSIQNWINRFPEKELKIQKN